VKIYTKKSLIEKLKQIRSLGWIQCRRHGNVGGIGNTLEDLLEIKENNLPIPNAAEWELKCQRLNKHSSFGSLTTLFHLEPSPQALKFVSSLLLPKYGWRHKESGKKYPLTEMSFRQTICAKTRSDRGFGVIVDRSEKKVIISFNATFVKEKHLDWLTQVKDRIGTEELSPQPYWGFDDLFHKAGTKLHNCFFVGARKCLGT
jgi:MvaI/BcnI restriction endonuclease family